jgi:hypothetical protein
VLAMVCVAVACPPLPVRASLDVTGHRRPVCSARYAPLTDRSGCVGPPGKQAARPACTATGTACPPAHRSAIVKRGTTTEHAIYYLEVGWRIPPPADSRPDRSEVPRRAQGRFGTTAKSTSRKIASPPWSGPTTCDEATTIIRRPGSTRMTWPPPPIAAYPCWPSTGCIHQKYP